ARSLRRLKRASQSLRVPLDYAAVVRATVSPKRAARAKDVAMHVLNKVAARCSKGASGIAALLVVGIAACGAAFAQAPRTGGPTPSGPGAEVYFIDLKDGATVPAKLKLYFGLRNMGVAPAGSDRENSGHHHLLVDTELPALNQ